MKTTGNEFNAAVVHVLVTETLLYANFLLLSVLCLRRHHNTHATVVTTQGTYDYLIQQKHDLLNLAKFNIQSAPSGDPIYQSRWLKTRIHSFIQAPFLFLDVDALPLVPLKLVSDKFCAVPNYDSLPQTIVRYANNALHQFQLTNTPSSQVHCFKQLGWPLPSCYINSGVFYCPSNQTVHSALNDWSTEWERYSASTHHHYDQPALNHILQNHRINVQRLPASWNLPVPVTINKGMPFVSAKVAHFYLSERTPHWLPSVLAAPLPLHTVQALADYLILNPKSLTETRPAYILHLIKRLIIRLPCILRKPCNIEV